MSFRHSLALALGVTAFAGTVQAAPRVSLMYDGQYFCNACGGAYNHTVFKTVLTSQYPQATDITSIAAPTLAEALTRTDVLFWPFQWDKAMAADLTPEAVSALKAFVQNGGRMVFKTDYMDTPRHNRDVVEKVFGVRFGTVSNASSPAFTCDQQKATELGWQGIAASGQIPFYANFFTGALPPGVIPLCVAGAADRVVLAAYPFGDGIVYFDGGFSQSATDLTVEQKGFFHEMAEADLVSPHRCFVKDGVSKCSGGNSFGQLGIGDKNPHVDTYSALRPVDLGQSFRIARVENATGTSCALSTAGQLKCWGLNKDGQLGVGDVRPRGTEPTDLGDQLPALNLGGKVVDFAVGRAHVCALTEAGQLRCWGKGAMGQLGSESTASVGGQAGESPVMVDIGGRAKTLTTGRNHTCVLLDDKDVACFGDNSSGQLGVGSNVNVGDKTGTMGANLKRVDLGSNFDVAQLASGQDFNCALSERGQIKCWGANDAGQLGQGVANLTKGTKPEEMGEALPFTDLGEGQMATGLACGFLHCCATTIQHTMKCWGANDSGQLGIGDVLSRGRSADMGDHLPFTQLPPLESVLGMDLVGNTTCATTETGTRCWGSNATGQLATGDRLNRGDRPSNVPRLLTPTF